MWRKEHKRSGNKTSSINYQVALAVVPKPALTDCAARENTSTLPSFNFLTIKCGSCALPTSLIRQRIKTDVFAKQPSAKWVRGSCCSGRSSRHWLRSSCPFVVGLGVASKPGRAPLAAFPTFLFLFQCPCQSVSGVRGLSGLCACLFPEASRSIWASRTRKSRRRWRELGFSVQRPHRPFLAQEFRSLGAVKAEKGLNGSLTGRTLSPKLKHTCTHTCKD